MTASGRRALAIAQIPGYYVPAATNGAATVGRAGDGMDTLICRKTAAGSLKRLMTIFCRSWGTAQDARRVSWRAGSLEGPGR